MHMHGVGGPTVTKLEMYDLGVVSSLCPEIVILEIGTNDFSLAQPEVVGSRIDNLVRHLLDHYNVRADVSVAFAVISSIWLFQKRSRDLTPQDRPDLKHPLILHSN